jgi:hypothetical protein
MLRLRILKFPNLKRRQLRLTGPWKLHIKVTGKMGKAIIKNQKLLLVKSGNFIISAIKVFC